MTARFAFDERARRHLLRVAREAIEAEVRGRPLPGLSADESTHPNHGVFVTLRSGERLRGCIGTFHPEGDLLSTIRRIAAEATHDSRFTGTPLGPRDLAALRIELSLLSPLTPVRDVGEIDIGRHGIHVAVGGHRGCFLPSVATEHGWDAPTFLSVCCVEKIGVGPDAWRGPDAVVSVFEVEKVAE